TATATDAAPAPAPAGTDPWKSQGVLLADGDGDGTDDALGLVMGLAGPSIRVTARSGIDGRLLWQTADLPYTRLASGALARIGKILVVSDRGELALGLDLATGAIRWSVPIT